MNVSAYYSINLGRYNFAGTEKDWCVSLYTSFGNVSETWPEDAKPDIDGLLPSEVLDLIEERLDSYWINTGRKERKEKIAQIRGHVKEIDAAWLSARIAATENELADLKYRLADVVCADDTEAA